MIFYFQSQSGDIFSENNLKSITTLLNAVNDDVLSTQYCYKGGAQIFKSTLYSGVI